MKICTLYCINALALVEAAREKERRTQFLAGTEKDAHVVDRRKAVWADIETNANVVDRRDQVAVEVDVNEVDKRSPV